MLETVEHVCTITFVEIGVFLIGDILDEDRGVEIYQRTRDALRTIGFKIDGCERTIRTVALTYRCHTLPTSGMGIEIIGFLSRYLIFHFH